MALARVVLARKQHLRFERLQMRGEALDFALQFAVDVLAFARQLEQRIEVGSQPAMFASWAICSSRRLRSCMIFWLFSGFDQKSGALICSSSLANCARRAGASKIAPHSVSLLAERNVFSFQFVEGHSATSLPVVDPRVNLERGGTMNVTLSLNPEVEKGLLARARRRGISLDDYLQELVAREAGLPDADGAAPSVQAVR